MELIGLPTPNARKAKAFVPGRNAQGPVQSGSAHRDLAHRDPGHHVAARHVLGRHNLVPAANRGSPRGGRTIALLVHRLGLESAHRDSSSVRRSLDPRPRAKIGRLVDLRGVAVQMALAPSRRNRGRSPVPIVPIVQTVQPSNPTPARVAMLSLIVKKSRLPDPRGCRLKQSSPNANLRLAPLLVAPQPVAPQRAGRRFVVLALTGQLLVARDKAVPASSGRERTGQAQIVHGLIEPDQGWNGRDRTGQDQIGQRQTALVLIAPPSTAPAVHGQLAVPAAPALENSAQDGLHAPRAPARVPSPPAPANHAPAAPDHPTSAHPRQGNRRGNPSPVEQAGPLPEAAAAPSQHLARSPVVPRELVLATRANLVEPGNQADRDSAANARVGSLAARSEART